MNTVNRLPLRISFGVLSIFLSACTLNRSYWVEDQDKVVESGEIKSWAKIPFESGLTSEGKPFYKNLRVIEYDENGDRWESMQSNIARELVRYNAGPNVPVIVFVHGWRHNSHPDDSNLKGFNDFLMNFNKYTQFKKENPIGIFIGWRGASVNERGALGALNTLPALLSVVDRKEGADKVAGIPLASDLWMLRKEALKRDAKMVIVGHSFGGRIVERVVAPSILASHHLRGTGSRIVLRSDSESQADQGSVAGKVDRGTMMADLTVLINPASESLFARQLKVGLRGWPSYDPPAIISIKSETDSATGSVWPVMKYMELATNPGEVFLGRRYRLNHHRNPESRLTETPWDYQTKTAGNYTDRLLNGYIDVTETGGFRIVNPDLEKHYLTGEGYLVLRAHRRLINGHSGEPLPGEDSSEFQNHGIFTERMSKFIETIVHQSGGSMKYTDSELYKQLHPAN